MKERQQSSAGFPLVFLMVSSSDGRTPACGLAPTVLLFKNGAAPPVVASGTVSELVVAPPSGLATSGASSTGGSLAQSATYFYKVTALNALGETLPSSELSYSVPASGTATNQVTLTWSAATGATGYKVYRSTVTNAELLLASPGNVTSYADTTSTTPSGSTPTTNTTSGGIYALGGAGLATDTNTLGSLAYVATAAGADASQGAYTVVPWNPFDGVRMGMTSLPNAAANANGGLPVLSSSGTTLAYTVSTLTTYTGNTPQTGDAFARLGAPSGASIAADIQTRSTYAGADTSGTATLLARIPGTIAANGSGFTALGDARLANLDAAISSRSTYAGADTAGTATLLSRVTGAVALASQIPANFTTATFASAGVFATAALANAPTGGSAPSAATIAAAVLAQTLSAPRALDSVADAALTVNDALVAATSGSAGKESVSGTSFVVKTPAGTTIRTFTLDSSTAPTTRS